MFIDDDAGVSVKFLMVGETNSMVCYHLMVEGHSIQNKRIKQNKNNQGWNQYKKRFIQVWKTEMYCN